MSTRIDASGDSLSRTTNLPTITSFTICGWVMFVSDRGNQYQACFALGDASGSNYYVFYLESGTNERIGVWNGTTETAHASFGPTEATWYYAAMTVAGTGAGQHNVYVFNANGSLAATLSGAGFADNTAGKLWIGNDNDAEWSNLRVAAVKIYAAALTQAEIQAEIFSIVPKRRANLNAFYPMFAGASERLLDYSGNGYNWTAGGTLTDEAGPPVPWGIASAPAFRLPAAGGHTVAVNQVEETDLAQAITRLKNKLLGQNTETDEAQAITSRKQKLVGQNSETDSAQAIASKKQRAIGQVVETDVAQAITRGQIVVPVGQVSETDSVQAITARKALAVGQASEAETAQTIGARKIKSLTQATEIDQSQAITASKIKALAQTAEMDAAQAIISRKQQAIGQAGESDTAQSLTAQKAHAVTQAAETDVAQAITSRKIKDLGQAAETDTAQTISSVTGILVQQVEETDQAQPISRRKVRTVVQVTETNLTQAMQPAKMQVIAQIAETDLAQSLFPGKRVAVAQVVEIDLLQPITAQKTRLIQQVLEVDLAQALFQPTGSTIRNRQLLPLSNTLAPLGS